MKGGSCQKFSQGYGALYLQWYESFCARLAAVEVSFSAFLFAFSQVLFHAILFAPSQVLNEMVESLQEVQGISRVLYDLTAKPPGTTEWE